MNSNTRYSDLSENDLINELRGNTNLLDYLYKRHKDYCINFMRRMIQDNDFINDIYQDAIIVLYEKAKAGGFKLTCSIQTYLNSICRNQILAKAAHMDRYKTEEWNSDDYEENITDWLEDPGFVNQERVNSITAALKEMKDTGGNCYEILTRFFYKSQTMEQIAYEMDYTNADNVKNQKSRCQKRLKNRVYELLNPNR